MSTNTDEAFAGVVVAVGVQTAFGSANSTIAALTGTIDATDGCVLGDKGSGDADSGVSLPGFDAAVREVAAVPASFTESADAFLKAEISGFSITLPLQGNGATATPAAGEADFATLHSGIEAILETMGLIGANGTAPVVEYTPRHAGSTAPGSTVYSTWKIWFGDLEFVFSDCLIETASFAFTPGGNCLVTCDVKVGTFDHTTAVDVDAFPTVTYGSQASMTAPVVEGVNFDWGEIHGFENLVIAVNNPLEEFGDSNVATTGIRQSQSGRVFSVSGTLYVETTDSDFHFDNLVSGAAGVGNPWTAPTVDLSLQLGTAAGAADTINAFLIELNNLQSKAIKYNRVGTAMVVELGDSKATGTTVGGEFKLTAN